MDQTNGDRARTEDSDAALWQRAAEVLRRNSAGSWTKAAPNLYPHQWSWDSAFIAIGWAHLDPTRALSELERLFSRQWATGKVPHIVFDENMPIDSYFPDWTRWDCEISPDAPKGAPHTSGLCQPPVHALALLRILQVTEEGNDRIVRDEVRTRIAALLPRVVSWHRYLATCRDPERSGLVTTYHPWEGIDNSPRWDEALARIGVGEVPEFRRRDLDHVADPAERPTDRDYRLYLWLVELLKRARYDEDEIQQSYPFLIKDVFFSAVLVAANKALLELDSALGAGPGAAHSIESWIDNGRGGLAGRWDDDLGLSVDFDLRAQQPIRLRTFAGFAPLIAGELDLGRLSLLVAQLDSTAFTGDPRLRWALLPSTSPREPSFQPRTYWRGPTWPIIDWLIWRALLVQGESERAERVRAEALAQLEHSGLAEYFEPFTGEPLGSMDQSWTAAVALDWLAHRSTS